MGGHRSRPKHYDTNPIHSQLKGNCRVSHRPTSHWLRVPPSLLQEANNSDKKPDRQSNMNLNYIGNNTHDAVSYIHTCMERRALCVDVHVCVYTKKEESV